MYELQYLKVIGLSKGTARLGGSVRLVARQIGLSFIVGKPSYTPFSQPRILSTSNLESVTEAT